MLQDFANRLKEQRLKFGLSQDQLAKMVNTNKKVISTYENGSRQPSFETLVRFAILYRVSTDYLLGVTSNQTLDVSGLTESDIIVVKQLVEALSKKNKMLEEQSTR